MPGGIGPVSKAILSACSRGDRPIAPTGNSNEIFYNLDSRRVFFDLREHYLYFVDSSNGKTLQTIRATLQGLNSSASIEQVYLDPHKFFNGAQRVKVAPEHADTLLVALRIADVRTTIR